MHKSIILTYLLTVLCVYGSGVDIEVNDSVVYQEIEGFGAAITDSSAWLLENGLTEMEKTSLIQELFSQESGIGLNYVRYPMGASDFRLQNYTYDDMPTGQTDAALTNFSMSYDEAYLIPILQAISVVNTNMKIMGSPWSPPAWMKDSGNLYYGRLNDSAYVPYAQYFLRFVQNMESNGLPIHSVTLQNEPLYEPYDYPGMYMAPSNQARLATQIGQAFESNSIDTRLFVYDHNWDQFTYPVEVMDDPVARSYIAGSAFHAYAGDVAVQSLIHDVYPDKDIYFTEMTAGEWGAGFDDTLIWDTQVLLIGALQNWSKSVIKWNLALDQNNGPKISGGCETCHGLITINTDTHAITRNADYYSLAHVSKFLKSGAVRIASSESSSDEMNAVAFKNPDGEIILLACNPGSSLQNYSVRWNNESISYPLPARSVATITWMNTSGATADVWITSGDQIRLLEEQAYHPVFSASTINWQGHTWRVRDTDGNPGNNHWAADCVSIDSNDCLHLQVKQHEDTWYAAEVLSDDSPGYGTYRWHIQTQPEWLNSNLIAGLSTFFDAFNGLNIQFTKAFEETPTNMLYSVEPYYASGHQYFSDHTYTSEFTTHEFIWNPARVEYRSWYGHDPQPSDAGSVIAEWVYEGDDIPVDTNEQIRMNLWMYDGLPPETAQEFVLAGFYYQASTGTLVRDEFDDGMISNIWQQYNDSYVQELDDVLRIQTAATEPHWAGCRTRSDVSVEPDGRTFTFSACLASAVVTAASSGTADIWGYQALVSGSNGLFDAYAASNAVTLRVGYTLASDVARLEFYTKSAAANQWGTIRYVGVVSNASAFMNNAGLECTFSLMLSNYAVEVTYQDNPVIVYPISGSTTGLHQMGAAELAGRYVVGGSSEVGGRGSIAWNSIEVSADAIVAADTSGNGVDGPGVKVVQIGDADPGSTWKFPTDTTYTKHRSMVLYQADMVDRAGTITQLMLNILSAPDLSMNNYCIRFQHSSLDEISSVYINDNWTTVFEDTLTIPTDQQGWFGIPLNVPFEYNGVDNVLIDFCFDNTVKDSSPVPALTYSDTAYHSCFAASADKNDPTTWTDYPKGRKSKFDGNRMIDIRLAFSNAPLPQVCSNLSFESSARGFLIDMGGWQVDGSEYGGSIKASPVLHGTNALKIWKGPGAGDQQVYQDFAIEAGKAYMLSGYLLSLSTEPFVGSNTYGALRLEWYGAAGFLAEDESTHFTEESVNDVWNMLSISSAPPENCISGRLVCALSSSDDQNGSLYFDKLSLLSVESDSPTNAPPSSNNVPIARAVYLIDEFNDTQRSDIWTTSAFWDGTFSEESGGRLCIAPGSNIWHTAAYASAQPISWDDSSVWYVFSATLSTIRVDVAGSGEDMDSLIGICSLPDNPWWVTNSCSLYGHYDSEVDTLRLRFLTKTGTPANNGTDRYGGTINHVSSYLNPTNHICMSIALGFGQYEVTATDKSGHPIPLSSEYGLSRDSHNLGGNLYNGYWFVGAQNDSVNRGAVFWDRTEVFENHAPTAMLHFARQTSTNGTGYITITGAVNDVDGDFCRAYLEVSTNGSASWSKLDIMALTSMYGASLAPSEAVVHLTGVATTNATGLLADNYLSLTWTSLGADNEYDFLNDVWSNLIIRMCADDQYVSAAVTDIALPVLDNLSPDAQSASVQVITGALYSFDSDVDVAWSNFTDTSDMKGYYIGVNASYSENNPWQTSASALLTGLPVDSCSTISVWAVDEFGNVSDAIEDSIIILGLAGDWDHDGLLNTNEITYNTSPISDDSDGDEMFDGWEVSFGFNPDDVLDGALDNDSDGYLNAQESIMGTLPDDAQSLQMFKGLPEQSNTTPSCLTWSSVTGRTYTIQSKQALEDEWQDITTLSGTGSDMIYTNSLLPAERSYYRIQVMR